MAPKGTTLCRGDAGRRRPARFSGVTLLWRLLRGADVVGVRGTVKSSSLSSEISHTRGAPEKRSGEEGRAMGAGEGIRTRGLQVRLLVVLKLAPMTVGSEWARTMGGAVCMIEFESLVVREKEVRVGVAWGSCSLVETGARRAGGSRKSSMWTVEGAILGESARGVASREP